MQKYLIYLATNLINTKKYVGQTQHDRLEKRVQEHWKEAKSNKTKNVPFHNALLEYGLENFKFEIIEDNIDEKQIDLREQYWIAFYNTYIHAKDSNGYNVTLGGQGTHGYKFTEQDRKKMGEASKKYWEDLKTNPTKQDDYEALKEKRRQANLGKKMSEESKKKLSNSCLGRIPWNKNKKGCQQSKFKGTSVLPNICQFDLITGQLINKFTNATVAGEFIVAEQNLDVASTTCANRIAVVCRANKGHAYNYIWRFDTDIDKLPSNILEQEHIPAKAKAIAQYDLNNNLITVWESAAVYSKTVTTEYNKQRNIAKAISSVCNGKAKTYKNFIWKYIENDKEVM